MKYIRINDPGFLGWGTKDCIGPVPTEQVQEQLKQLRSQLNGGGRYHAALLISSHLPEGGRNHWKTAAEYKAS